MKHSIWWFVLLISTSCFGMDEENNGGAKLTLARRMSMPTPGSASPVKRFLKREGSFHAGGNYDLAERTGEARFVPQALAKAHQLLELAKQQNPQAPENNNPNQLLETAQQLTQLLEQASIAPKGATPRGRSSSLTSTPRVKSLGGDNDEIAETDTQ